MSELPIVVIGGGAAGIIAAWRAASLGGRVIVLERNKKLGIKLLISGGGKCNITHAGAMEEVRTTFVAGEARFLKPSFFQFTNDDIARMIEAKGVKTYVRPNGRIFPLNGSADDVVDALASYLDDANVDVRLNARVISLKQSNGQIEGVKLDKEEIRSHHVVIATGGASYPKTGTTGDGVAWAKDVGHTIIPLRPALAPIGVEPRLPADWRGIALRNGSLMVFADGKKVAEWRDDIMFSHEGVTGPAALEVSRAAAGLLDQHDVELRFDFFPAKEFLALDAELNALVLSQRDKMIATLLNAWLPNRLVEPLLTVAGVDAATRGHTFTRNHRRSVVQVLKDWKLGNVATVNLERGEVTAGGVTLGEVDPRTMRSRKVKGLYLCGEVLDVAGRVGGYNLQAAFSTGFVAGETAARDCQQEIGIFDHATLLNKTHSDSSPA
ncbi:MAG: aminoacetone oxidase family FAD-binding enzyme [Ignavibacteriae bacterium]|nr:aminoacetone oxidase family FAD-binding enzyme [Ignavibacteriota bacterium]